MNFSSILDSDGASFIEYPMSGETDAALSLAFNDSANGTADNCTNDYCVSDDDYVEMMETYIFPTTYEWVLIAFHCVVFIVGLVGNALVCVAVYRNHTMRTVTNYFIVNLAVADFMVILFCLPPTVLWDVTETWFMGTALCKIVLYFQTVSVAVSVLTLTFISVDRWYAICFPLKFKSTTNRAKTAIFLIWLIALSFDIPELIYLDTRHVKELKVDTIFFTQCLPSWDHDVDMTLTTIKVVVLYTCPLLFMSVAYCQIVRVLWRSANIPGHAESNKYKQYHNNGVGGGRRNPLNSAANATTECQLRSRRKAAKMLVAVVVMFAVCYFPVHLLSILSIVMELPQNQSMVIFSMLSHWLCYANSAVNPVIYNFMSGKFRREFKRAICQCHRTDPTNQYYTNHTQSEYPLHTRTGTLMSRTESSRYPTAMRSHAQLPMQTLPPRTVWRSVSTSSKGAPNALANSQL